MAVVLTTAIIISVAVLCMVEESRHLHIGSALLIVSGCDEALGERFGIGHAVSVRTERNAVLFVGGHLESRLRGHEQAEVGVARDLNLRRGRVGEGSITVACSL